jgi:hypothetical protein
MLRCRVNEGGAHDVERCSRPVVLEERTTEVATARFARKKKKEFGVAFCRGEGGRRDASLRSSHTTYR